MSNDITNLSNNINHNIASKLLQSKVEANNVETKDSKNLDSTLSYLDSIGHAQVNMHADMNSSAPSNGVIYSMEILKNDPCGVESYNDFCDTLIEKGYSLEDAMYKADAFFSCLKNSSTYHQ